MQWTKLWLITVSLSRWFTRRYLARSAVFTMSRIVQLTFIAAMLAGLVSVTMDTQLQNPSPVPLEGVAVFTCSATTAGLSWTTNAVNGSQVPDTAVGRVWRSSQLRVPALPENNNTDMNCQTFEQQQITAQLYIYG